jgi:acetyltransferase-like isoleucine patch superfamily enzyme
MSFDISIHPLANVYGKNVKIGIDTKIAAFVEIGHKVVIGDNCSIGAAAFIPEGVIIEDNVFVGPHVVFTNDKFAPSRGQWRKELPIIVKSGASIGANATILPGVVIGRNARIGAGSVVTKNIPDNSVAYGNPAVVVGEREK